jgi:hypothetical protein
VVIGASLLFAGCAAQAGDPCDDEGDDQCLADGSVLVCSDGAWAEDATCTCEPLTGVMQCAIPGFVGLDRAGRVRRARRSLRRA